MAAQLPATSGPAEGRLDQVRSILDGLVWQMRSPEDIVPVVTTLREGLQERGLRFTHPTEE